MQLKVSAILALVLHACCVMNTSRADDGSPITTDANRATLPRSVAVDTDADSDQAVHGRAERPVIVRSLPGRLERISHAADWGLADTCTLSLRLINATDRAWRKVTADGGCTCLVVDVDDIPETGVMKGESVTVTIVYSKPQKPSLTPRSIHFSIDDSPATLPVLVEWYSPVLVQSLRQTGKQTWRLVAVSRENWSIQGVETLNPGVKVHDQARQDGTWVVDLSGGIEIAVTCRLRFTISPNRGGETVKQMISVPLRNDEPRSIPARLICRYDDAGHLVGETRLLFPRARLEGRPALERCLLIAASREGVPLQVSQKALGKTVLKVEFTSASALDSEAWGEDSRVRFEFEGGSHLDCPFLVSKG